jgi:hypothetical protein
LTGEEIPLGARIIHVADALDSMPTTRIYRAARRRRGAHRASPGGDLVFRSALRSGAGRSRRPDARSGPTAQASRSLLGSNARTWGPLPRRGTSVLAFLQLRENALDCLHGTAAPPPCGGRHRSGSTCSVPGRHSQALHGRGDPRAADG